MIATKFNAIIVVKSGIFGIKDNIIIIRVYKEINYFGFLIDIDEETIIKKIGINELEQKICDMIFDIYRVSEFDYAFCDNEAEIEFSPDEFKNLKEKIYSILVLPINGDKRLELKLIKSNWKIDGYSLRK
ncbi:Imm64 family immunity protein [Caloramator sp. Dgby_cultured_2]|uniref:Imm64 family immunity protein n=1 Tax=Caloramator sp. Dgby_cultured_2 TaxID=3029174 RepID=UPI00237D6186|nr:Imm64 family immunity protein [Caloramator sp. Dgby_cultured_2]WDU84435.1 Imm64 family immunity protein [Caloramator sp. Dgby_cultured_2]